MDVALVDPEIPQNTGSIARMCSATGVGLHLVGKIGFSLDDRYLKRAGLDYWKDVCVGIHADWASFIRAMGERRAWLFSKKADRMYCHVEYRDSDILVFGCESNGLPSDILESNGDKLLRIPIYSGVRSLNLSGAVHVAVFHALERQGFPGFPGG